MRSYSVTNAALSGANSPTLVLIEIQTSAAHSYSVAQAWLGTELYIGDPGARQNIQIAIMSGTSTGALQAPTVSPLDPDDPASLITVQGQCTTPAAVQTVLVDDTFSWVPGSWLYTPAPSERIWVHGGQVLALWWPTTQGVLSIPFSYTVDCGITLIEVS